MFDYIQYAYGQWRWDSKPRQNTNALPISQDELRSQLRNIPERKPDGYKSSQASSIRFLPNTNLTAK